LLDAGCERSPFPSNIDHSTGPEPESNQRQQHFWTGLRFQIWSFAFTLFRAFDFVCPFARSPFFGPFARFPAGKRFSNNFQKNAAFWEDPEKIWLEFDQNSANFGKLNFVKISEIFSDF